MILSSHHLIIILSGVADIPGRDPPEQRRGEQDQRHGVQPLPDAAPPRDQVRVRGLAGVGGHAGHRAQQGQLRGVQASGEELGTRHRQ